MYILCSPHIIPIGLAALANVLRVNRHIERLHIGSQYKYDATITLASKITCYLFLKRLSCSIQMGSTSAHDSHANKQL